MGIIINTTVKLLLIVAIVAKAIADDNSTVDDSKVILRNSIAYHFVKNVKAIELELFVTRKIDIAPMLKGLEKIQNVRDRVLVMCKRVPHIAEATNAKLANEAKPPAPTTTAFYIPISQFITHAEAKAKCKALGYQLPEIYTNQEMVDLVTLMKRYSIRAVHAGLEWDQGYAIFRFMATGSPFWHGYQKQLYYYNGDKKQFEKSNWKTVSHRGETQFVYTSEGHIAAYFVDNVYPTKNHFYRHYWDSNSKFSVFSLPSLICQSRWNGTLLPMVSTPKGWEYNEGTITSQAVTIERKKRTPNEGSQVLPTNSTRVKRTLKMTVASNNTNRSLPFKSFLEELCYSVSEHLTETFERSQYRLFNALKQVDISINNKLDDKDLDKRSVDKDYDDALDFSIALFNATEENPRFSRGLPSLIFKTGIKGIWGLLGFIEKVRTRRRIGKIEKILDKQGQDISALTKEVMSHSYSITQLTLVTQDLSRRLDSLNARVDELEVKLSNLGVEVRLQQLLQILDSLIGRTDQAFTFAFTTLENIIQHALIGQASAFLLPTSKLEELQEEVNKISSAIVDTAYERMKATIISDPLSPASLTCFVNLYATTRKTRELVRLIPIPWYQGSQALIPMLDYDTILLDQEAGFYTVIDPSEVNGCLDDKCITSNPEVSTTAPSCGVPQLYDRHLSNCVNDDIPSNGMFLKQLLYDGILYSIRQESNIQIFCTNSRMSKTQKIQGSGLINLPRGCTMAVTDPQGTVSKIQSSPLSHLYETQAVELVPTGPSEIFQTSVGTHSNVTSNLVRMLNQQLEELNQRLSNTTEEVESQNFYVILLASLLGIVSLACIIIACFLYRYSRRFRRRVNRIVDEVTEKISDAKRTFVTFEQLAAQRARAEDDVKRRRRESPAMRAPAKSTVVALPGMAMPKPAGQSSRRHDSLQSIIKHLDDLELQVLLLDDDLSSMPSDYVTPMSPVNDRGTTECYFTKDVMAPPVPPKPSTLAIPYKPALSADLLADDFVRPEHTLLKKPNKK